MAFLGEIFDRNDVLRGDKAILPLAYVHYGYCRISDAISSLLEKADIPKNGALRKGSYKIDTVEYEALKQEILKLRPYVLELEAEIQRLKKELRWLDERIPAQLYQSTGRSI